jgi:membrane associated rhomboid family serine protease
MFFLFFSGIFRNYIPLIALSLIVAFVYGSSFWSIFPFARYVDVHLSWEGHLAGAISGIVVAVVFRNQGPQNPEKIWNDEDNLFDDEIESENHADGENLN